MNGRIEWNFTRVDKETRTRFASIFKWRQYLDIMSSYGALAGCTTVDTLVDLESTRSRLENACIPASSMQGSFVKILIMNRSSAMERMSKKPEKGECAISSIRGHHSLTTNVYSSFFKLGVS
jgi:hypothetical protein